VNVLVSCRRGNCSSGWNENRKVRVRPPSSFRRRYLHLIAIVFVGAVLSEFGIPTSAVAQVKVRVETVSGKPVFGALSRLTGSQLELQQESGDKQSVEIRNVLAISATDFDDVRGPPISKTPWLFLSTGDRLRMTSLVIDDDSIVAKWSSFTALPAISLPLELCRGFVMAVPSSAIQQGRSFDKVLSHQQQVDLITLSNGDRVEGEFISLEDEQFTLKTSIGAVRTKIDQTQSLVFNPDLVSEPETVERVAILSLSDGSTLHVSSIISDGDLMIGESIGGFEISIPVTTLHTIRFYDSNHVDLTRLKPEQTTVTPYLSMHREPKLNRNVIGGFLSLRGRLVPTGFGVTSGTTQTWKLDREYQQFRATVGIDDAAQGAGSVIFQVHVDGTVAWQSDRMTGASAPVEIPPVDLTKADELSLVVEFSDRGNVLDYANWCEPVLIRKPVDVAR